MRRLMFLVVPVFALGAAACGRDAAAVPGKPADEAPAAATEIMKTMPADPDPCAWITGDEAAKLLGPLDGAPWRADHSDSPDPDPNGHACGYTLADRNSKVIVELLTEDANSFEGGVSLVAGRLGHDVGQKTAGEVVGSIAGDAASSGWDYTGTLPNVFIGRLGNIAIRVGTYGDHVPTDSLPPLAALVRDRIPDLPIAVPPKLANHGDGPNPCELVTREEAEAALGKLVFPPYRSNSHKSSFADPGGEGCSYFLGKHRVFTIDATWEQGKTIFGMSAGFGANIAAALGGKGPTADTLDGNWDQAGAGPTGNLYLLKGDQMLEISYGMAGVDLAATVRLAKLAVGRLH